MGLSHLLATAFLTVAAIAFGTSVFRLLSDQSAQRLRELDESNASKMLGIVLKKRFEGTRSFQNLEMKVPGLGFKSQGPGFFVQSDTDFFGKPSPGNDRLIIVTKSIGTKALHLTTGYSPFNPLQVKGPGAASLSEVPTAGDYLVVSNVQHSEMLRVSAAPGQGSSWSIDPDLASSVSPTLAGVLRRHYVAGDSVEKAEFHIIGLDPSSKSVLDSTLGTGTPVVIGTNVRSFSAHYNLRDSTFECPSVSTASNIYTRDQWTDLNAEPSGKCYSRMKGIKIAFTTATKRNEYLFFANN